MIFEKPRTVAEVTGPGDVEAAVASFDLGGPRPVLVVVGGAGLLDEAAQKRLAPVFAEIIVPAVLRHDAAAVDGGTDSGVMRLLGQARAGGPGFPLIGVAARGTVRFPGHEPATGEAADLDPNHSHIVLTPGAEWGAESPYLPLVAIALAAGRPVVTVLTNGGEIALDDAAHSLRLGIPLLVLAGTGRTADQIATAATGPAPSGDERLALLARSELVRVVPVNDRTALAGRLDESLTR